MSDDPSTARPTNTPAGLYEHWCDHPGCKAWGGWGYTRGKIVHWFCPEHRSDGEAIMGGASRP